MYSIWLRCTVVYKSSTTATQQIVLVVKSVQYRVSLCIPKTPKGFLKVQSLAVRHRSVAGMQIVDVR